MTAYLHRRLKMIEDRLGVPDDGASVAILFEPRETESLEAWAAYESRLGEAQRTAESVYVIGVERTIRQAGPGNIVYEPFDVYALGAIYATKQGGKQAFSKLAKTMLASLSGNVIGPNQGLQFSSLDEH